MADWAFSCFSKELVTVCPKDVIRIITHRTSTAVSDCHKNSTNYFQTSTSLAVYWSEFLITDYEVPGSILGSTMGIFR
jgi:hypothetical protein